MKLKKCASLVMAAAMVLGTLSGCGGTGGTAKSSEAGTADTTAESSQESKESKEKQSGGNLVVRHGIFITSRCGYDIYY